MIAIALMKEFWSHLRYSFRLGRSSVGPTIVAILSLALGIGANSAVFSVVEAVLFRPLPYPEPNRIVRIGTKASYGAVSIPQYQSCKERGATAFESVAAYRDPRQVGLENGGKRDWISVMPITDDFFRTLRVAPTLGREFQPQDLHSSGARPIILTHGIWQRTFNSDPNVIGRTVNLGTSTGEIVAVLPRKFWFPGTPEAFEPLLITGDASDRGTNTHLIARLRPALDFQRAEAALGVINDNPQTTNSGSGDDKLALVSFHEWLTGNVRLRLLLFFGSVGLLLLICCLNVAGIVLARFAGRQKEIGVRLALGSTRFRLFRQFAAENLMLCMGGSVVGLFGAFFALRWFMAFVPLDLPTFGTPSLNLSVLAFTIAVAFAAALLLSLVPLFSYSAINVYKDLKAAERTYDFIGVRVRLRSLLLGGEVSLCVVLLFLAALLMQSLYRLHTEPLGFEPRNILTFYVPSAPNRYRAAADRENFRSSLRQRLLAIPGVSSVAATNVLPLTVPNNFPTQRDGHPEQSIGGMEIRFVTSSYFETLGVPILKGRAFSDQDRGAAAPVAIVNETLARRWWPNGDSLGDRLVVGRMNGADLGDIKEPAREVVGIAADTKSVYLKEKSRPTVYIPVQQAPWMDEGMNWAVRATPSSALANDVRRVVADIDPFLQVKRVRTLNDIVGVTMADTSLDAWLFGCFAGLALVLTVVGVYGFLSFSVAQRTNEIAIRMALGASRRDVLLLVLKQAMRLTTVGVALGLAIAVAATRFISSLLFGVRSSDPLTFIGVTALVLCVALLASQFPALRATRVDPNVALRWD